MSIAQNLDHLRKSVAEVCSRVGREPSSVRILAVSKLQPIELIEEAYVAGIRDFGENYVQELVEKRRRLMHLNGIRWHLIGHLQTNKVKTVIQEADCFHALDSEKLIREIVKRASRPWPVFIEVNVDDELSKTGIHPEVLGGIVRKVRQEPLLKLEGLMCIPEPRPEPALMRPAFRKLGVLAREHSAGGPLALSMGMSADFEVAVEEGSNWIRVGTRLFGDRSARH